MLKNSKILLETHCLFGTYVDKINAVFLSLATTIETRDLDIYHVFPTKKTDPPQKFLNHFSKKGLLPR